MNYELRMKKNPVKKSEANAAQRFLIFNFSFLILLLTACGAPQPTKTAGGAVFDISPEILASRADTLVDIGPMRSGEVVQYDARLRNTGAEPLVIKEISTSCGCTSVEYDKQPIAPGAEGAFSFRFDSRGMWGVQMKLIEIRTSAGQRPYQILVQAEVAENSGDE
jgi:hypothetical protein